MLKPVADNERAYQQHDAFSVGFYLKCSFDEARCGYTSYRKDEEDVQNPGEWFVDKLRELAEELNDEYKNPQRMTLHSEKSTISERPRKKPGQGGQRPLPSYGKVSIYIFFLHLGSFF